MPAFVDNRGRQLMAVAATMFALLLVGELHHQLSVKPVVPPRLFFGLAEVVLLLGSTVAGTLLIFRVWVPQMATAIAIMVALLLIGDWHLGDKHVSAWTLLLEMFQVITLLGCTVACTLLAQRVGAPR